MCQVLKKCLELHAMLHITIYSFLTLIYVIAELLLATLLLGHVHDQWQDFGLFFVGTFVSIFLYVQALACLTATDRL